MSNLAFFRDKCLKNVQNTVLFISKVHGKSDGKRTNRKVLTKQEKQRRFLSEVQLDRQLQTKKRGDATLQTQTLLSEAQISARTSTKK